MNRDLYPKNWNTIAFDIKEAAGWKCQDCGKECRRKGESHFDFIQRIQTNRVSECPIVAEYVQHPQRWTLTVAHLNHRPEDCRPENLKALCAPCHCRYDLKAMAIKKRLHLERNGQLSLEV